MSTTPEACPVQLLLQFPTVHLVSPICTQVLGTLLQNLTRYIATAAKFLR